MVEVEKSEVLTAAAAAFKSLWQSCYTPPSTNNRILDLRVTHSKQDLTDKRDLILDTLAKVPNAVKNAARSY